MRRWLHLLIVLTFALGALGTVNRNTPARAQEGPTGIFYGTWPYQLPPDQHLNSFVTGGANENLGVAFWPLVELPSAWYIWAEERYEPLLAEEFGFDGEEAYVLKIHKDATWSNGTPVTADDVLGTYAIGRILVWEDFNYVDHLEKVDDKTVRFVLSVPTLRVERLILKTYIRSAETYAPLIEKSIEMFESGATSTDQAWLDLQTEIKEFRPEAMIASGPYVYSLDDVGDSYMTLHWQPNSHLSSQVKFGEIRIWAGETEATTPLVLSGEIAHATNNYPPSTQQAFLDAGIRILRPPLLYGAALYFNHNRSPWNIKEVRQAVAMVIDREENAFLQRGLSGRPVQYMAGLSDALVPFWLDEETINKLNPYTKDLEEAAALLESIGFEQRDGKWYDADGNPVQGEYIFQAEWTDFAASAQHATDELNAFGFDITARAVPWQQQLDDIRDGNFDLAVMSWGRGSPFPADHFTNPLRRFNYLGLTEGRPGIGFQMQFEWNGEQIDLDKMIADSAAGMDREAQKALVAQIALIYNDLLPCVPLSELVGTEPLNEQLLSGIPAEDDPIWQNVNSENAITYLILMGVLGPAQ